MHRAAAGRLRDLLPHPGAGGERQERGGAARRGSGRIRSHRIGGAGPGRGTGTGSSSPPAPGAGAGAAPVLVLLLAGARPSEEGERGWRRPGGSSGEGSGEQRPARGARPAAWGGGERSPGGSTMIPQPPAPGETLAVTPAHSRGLSVPRAVRGEATLLWSPILTRGAPRSPRGIRVKRAEASSRWGSGGGQRLWRAGVLPVPGRLLSRPKLR